MGNGCLGTKYLNMAENRRSLKIAKVFTAMKSTKKREMESRNKSEIPAINTVVSSSTELRDSRFVNAAGINYINDALQVTYIAYIIRHVS